MNLQHKPFNLLVIISFLFASEYAYAADFLYSGRSFSLRSKITTVDHKDSSELECIVDESYSHSQKRARLDYKIGGINQQNVQFIYDATSKLGVQVSEARPECRKVNLDNLRHDLHAGSEEVKEYMKHVYEATNDRFNNVIGPANVLFQLAQVSNDFVLSNLNDPRVRLRNQEITKYEVTIGKARIWIAYGVTGQVDKIKLATEQVPLQVIIGLDDATIFIHYYSHSIMDSDTVRHSHLQTNDGRLIDHFSFPLVANCSTQLASARNRLAEKDPFMKMNPETSKFSFTSISEGRVKFRDDLKHFVAFNGISWSMRIDTAIHYGGENVLYTSTKMFDFRSNRKYVIIDRSNNDSSFSKNDVSKMNRCITTYINKPQKENFHDRLALNKLLFGAEELTYMGMAKVRGIIARVYEAGTSNLPIWFGQPVVYRTLQGNFKTRERGRPVGEDKKWRQVLVFVTLDNSGRGPQLLRLEAYHKALLATGGTKIVRTFTTDFYNFGWHLSDAPNGDSASRLFVYHDTCSASGTALDDYHEVDLLLKNHYSAKKPMSNMQWIRDTMKRNEAINSGLRDSLELPGMMMYDLESHILNESIAVRFRVAEHPQLLLTISYIGRADYTKKTGTGVNVYSSAQTFTECLWMTGGESLNEYKGQLRLRYILYLEKEKLCVTNSNPTGNAGSLTGAYNMNDNGEGELFRVEPIPDSLISLRGSWLNQKQIGHLKDRIVVVQSLAQDTTSDSVDAEVAIMEIGEVELKNIGQRTSTALSRLSYASSSGYTRTVISDETIDRNSCEALCLADLDCKSYSFCESQADLGKSSQCILSSLDLESVEVQRILEKELQNYKPMIEFEVNNMNVKLERKLNCDIQHKHYLHLFQTSSYTRVAISSNVVNITAFESEEMCAKKCFEQSLAVIEEGADMNSMVSNLLKDSPHDMNSLLKTEQKRKQVMAKFCSRMMYLEAGVSFKDKELIRRLSEITKDSGEDTNGYCVLEMLSDRPKIDLEADLNATQLLLNSYSFDFSTLYQRQYGISLDNTVDTIERNIIYELEAGANLSQEQMDLIRNGLKSGRNYQIRHLVTDVNQCARNCFLQRTRLWPACRSFDIVTKKAGLFCQLNTATLTEDYHPSIVVQANGTEEGGGSVHFELKFNKLKSIMMDEYKLDLVIDRRSIAHVSFLGSIMITILVLIGLSSGVFVGIKLANRFSDGFAGSTLNVPLVNM